MPAKYRQGIHLALLTALISGVSIFVNKFAVSSLSQPLVFTTIKNALVACLIISLILASGKWRQLSRLNRRHWLQLLLIGAIGGSVPFYLFFTGLSAIPAVSAAIIQKTLVIWVAVLAIPFLKEKLSPSKLIAILALFAANAFIGGFPGFSFSSSEFMILAATLLWAIESVIAKRVLATVDPDLVTAARMGFGSLILFGLLTLQSPSLSQISGLSSVQWSWVALTAGLLLTYVSVWYRALRLAPATTVTAILVASTLVTNLLSAVFITHRFSSAILVQSLIILIAVRFIYRLEAFTPPLSALLPSSESD